MAKKTNNTRNNTSIGIITLILLLSVVGMNTLTTIGFHHIPIEQVYIQNSFSGVQRLHIAENIKTCYTPTGERLDVGHCWYHSRKDQWYWCRPELVDRTTGERVSINTIESSLGDFVTQSTYGIAGVAFVQVQKERCVRYEGEDTYQ